MKKRTLMWVCGDCGQIARGFASYEDVERSVRAHREDCPAWRLW